MISEHGLVNPPESMMRGFRLYCLGKNRCEAQMRILPGPIQYEFLLVNIVGLASTPVKVNLPVYTPFQYVT